MPRQGIPDRTSGDRIPQVHAAVGARGRHQSRVRRFSPPEHSVKLAQ
jgi:hypothetical protein